MNAKTYKSAMKMVIVHFLLMGDEVEVVCIDIPIAKAVTFVPMRNISKLFPVKKERRAALSSLGGMSCNEDDADAIISRDGPLWLSETHEMSDYIHTGRMIIDGVGLTPVGLDQLVADGVIPKEFAPALGFDPDLAKGVRNTGKFKRWLANEWVDPTAGGPFTRDLDAAPTSTGRQQVAKRTTAFVTQLSYSFAEAQAERARIDRSDWDKGTKAAAKAHVTRRIVREVAA